MTYLQLPTDFYKQGLINGNFRLWQTGTSFTNPATIAYTADQWYCQKADGGGTAPSVNVARNAITFDYNSKYTCKLSVTAVGTADAGCFWGLSQNIENWGYYAGKTITVSFRAITGNVALNKAVIDVYHNGTGTREYKEITLTNVSDTKYSFTCKLPTDITTLGISIFLAYGTTYWSTLSNTIPGATGDVIISQMQLSVGTQKLNFEPKKFEDDLFDCQRYVYKNFDADIVPANGSIATTNMTGIITTATACTTPCYRHPRQMYATPTMTYYQPNTSSTPGIGCYWNGVAWTDFSSTGTNSATNTVFDIGAVIGASTFGTALAVQFLYVAEARF